MSELEDQLGSILGNPKMMEQIMSLAQSMGEAEPSSSPGAKSPPPSQDRPSPPPGGDMDLAMIQALTGFAKKSCIDRDQKALLNALRPYLCKEKIEKLEKAMRAARMAQQAASLMDAGGKKGF